MEKAPLFLPLVILLMQCLPIVPVTVSTTTPKVEVRENSDAVLSCGFRTEKEPNPRIEWKKKGTDVSFVYYEGQFRGAFAGRARIKGATVTLQRVTQKDAGEYRCEITAPHDTITLGETNITLTVLVPPHTPSCEIPSSALTGSMVQLRCLDQQSIPPATYSWYKDDKLLTPSRMANATYHLNPFTGILEFKTVARGDTGQYSCLASNKVGQSKMCEAKHMKIEDVNMAGVVAAVVVICLVIAICGFGGYYAHRNGYFRRHKGRSFWIPQCHGVAHISSQNLHRTEDKTNANYSPPPQDPADFKHTQSFML
ncbi:junctional adhesion molecule B isoform X1 [Oncorhynchus mykiss]|uniref:junctional adhesion molecule B isoform X1 n=1 Tax=Oncorhynchus mykiss TaxID=8022 RepID=UPI0018781674|nr:junctional adhesion molecule B isoform X1 [Oncorhynchus mykiss]